MKNVCCKIKIRREEIQLQAATGAGKGQWEKILLCNVMQYISVLRFDLTDWLNLLAAVTHPYELIAWVQD